MWCWRLKASYSSHVEPAGKPESERFRDPLVRLWNFLGETLVRCPRCDGRASVLPVSQATDGRQMAWTRRSVTCLACGYAAYVPKTENDRMVIRQGREAPRRRPERDSTPACIDGLTSARSGWNPVTRCTSDAVVVGAGCGIIVTVLAVDED